MTAAPSGPLHSIAAEGRAHLAANSNYVAAAIERCDALAEAEKPFWKE